MNKIFLASLACISILFSCEQRRGSGNLTSQTRSTEAFSALDVSNNFRVEIKKGPSKVVVQADDNLISYVKVKVVSGELQIGLSGINVNDAHLKVMITTPDIRKIHASASADVIVMDEMRSAETIDLSASSSASIKAKVDAPEVQASVSSSGEITLSGHTKDFHVTSSSGANVSAKELLSENSYVNASSGANAHVYASVMLDANASSGGSIITMAKQQASKDRRAAGVK